MIQTMGLVEAMNNFFIKSTEVEIGSESVPGEQLEQTQRLGELQDDSEVSELVLGLEFSQSATVSDRRHTSQFYHLH